MKTIRILLFFIWISSFFMCLLAVSANFEFTSKAIRILCLFVALPGSCLLISLFIKNRKNAYFAFWIVLTVSVIVYRVLTLFEGRGNETQSIRYVNRADEKRVIIFQMEDVGAFGYNKRTVEFKNFGPLNYVREITPLENPDPKIWKQVNIDLNELNLKY